MNKITAFLVVLSISLFCTLQAETLELASGRLKLVVYPESGSFTLFQLSDVGKNRYEPLMDDRNNSATTRFSVSVNGRIFALAPRTGRPVVANLGENNIRLEFMPVDDVEVVQVFSFTPVAGAEMPLLRIDNIITNTSGKKGNFALKALFDTTLGENSGIHFSTDLQGRLSAETLLDLSVVRDNRLITADNESSLVFYFSSFDATRPVELVIANWERLNTLTWKPSVSEGRSFSTVYTVNDSAVLFFWPESTLELNKKTTVTLVLGPTVSDTGSAKAVVPAPTIKPVVAVTPAQTPAPLKPENYTLEYVLARIAELEANPDSASDEELAQLDALLDGLLFDKGAR